MKTIKEINELAPYDPCEWQEGYGIWQNGFMEGQKSEAAEMEQNPSDALILRIDRLYAHEIQHALRLCGLNDLADSIII